MQFTTTVTQKGQATIPAPIRKKLGIKPNTKVIFELKENEALVKPINDFFSLKGSIKVSKPFSIKSMDRAVSKQVAKEYAKEAH